MRQMIEAFNSIKDKNRKRYQRDTGIKFSGVRSLECNFNPATRKYNPHFHLIVANKEIADTLLREWLKKLTPKFVNPKAQKAEPVRDLSKSLIEIIKYGSKIFTEPDVKKKSISETDRIIYAAVLDNIFAAMTGLRIFERFGFNLTAGVGSSTGQMKLAIDYRTWRFSSKNHDWIDKDTGECLTEFCPDKCLLALLKERIDRELD